MPSEEKSSDEVSASPPFPAAVDLFNLTLLIRIESGLTGDAFWSSDLGGERDGLVSVGAFFINTEGNGFFLRESFGLFAALAPSMSCINRSLFAPSPFSRLRLRGP